MPPRIESLSERVVESVNIADFQFPIANLLLAKESIRNRQSTIGNELTSSPAPGHIPQSARREDGGEEPEHADRD